MREVIIRIFGCILFLILLVETVSAATPEEIFQDAIKYTVKVRTSIEMPFSEEEDGVFTGTGFVVDVKRGWILTNAHVAGYSPSRVKVAFKNTEYYKVEKLYVDPYLDVAILRMPAGSLPKETIVAPLECEKVPSVGHPVGAFGHPWSLTYTGTRGIISGSTFFSGNEWLQTDAPINAGNSGGPLISMRTGRLVGINTASVAEEDVENLNFAVPMRNICKILTLLREGVDPSPPILPVRFLDYDDNHRELVVAETYTEEGDASIKSGDIILGVDGKREEIQNESQFVHLLRGKHGYTKLHILRDGKALHALVNVRQADKLTLRTGVYVSGLIVAPSSYINDKEIGFGNVLMVHNVEDGTAGQSEGVATWDFIKTIDGKHINNLDELFVYLTDATKNMRDVEIVLKRISDSGRHIFTYKRIRLPIEGLKMIGHQKEIQALARKE